MIHWFNPNTVHATSVIYSAELADGYPDDDDADDKRMVEILEKLDERSLNLLLSTIDTSDFDGEPAQDSLVKREEKALAYAWVEALVILPQQGLTIFYSVNTFPKWVRNL